MICRKCKKVFLAERKIRIYCSRRCKCIDLYRNPAKGKHWKISPDKIKNMSRGIGEKSPNWIGDKIGYRGLHNWIEKERGKPHYCEHCKKDNLSHRQYNWANVSGKYKRTVSDWIRLCVKCHKKYDK